MNGNKLLAVISIVIIVLVVITVILVFCFSKKNEGYGINGNNGKIDSKNYNKRSYDSSTGISCLTNPSPIDAQFGSVLYIAGNTPIPAAKRRFLLYNSSKFTMKVISFTFGGYDRKYSSVTELIDEKLMNQYNYTNIVLPGKVFSLDEMNDRHVMYKGWYNSPIWIAYTLQNPSLAADIANGYVSQPSVSSLKYQVIGWYQMRLQDELSKYSGGTSGSSFGNGTMIRNACIHWKTGDNIGDARPLDLIGSDGQCKYYTELYTFDPVNVKSTICNLGIVFPNTVYLNDPMNLATCLRNIAMSGNALAMNSTIDLDNFMSKSELGSKLTHWIDNIDSSVSAILWFYTQIGKVMTNNGLSKMFKNAVTNINIKDISQQQLDLIATQFINGSTAESIGNKFLEFLGVFLDIIKHYIYENMDTIFFSIKNVIVNSIISAIDNLNVFPTETLLKIEKFLDSITLEDLREIIIKYKFPSRITLENVNDFGNKLNDTISSEKFQKLFLNISSKKLGELITSQIELCKAKFNIILPSLGISEISHGKSGKEKYAVKRRGWINSEMKKGKIGLDARCSGLWQIEYY